MKQIFTLILAFSFLLFGVTYAQQPLKSINNNQDLKKVKKPIVKKAVYTDISKPLREMKPIKDWYKFQKKGEHEEVPNFGLPINKDQDPFNTVNQNPNRQKNYKIGTKAPFNIGVNVDGIINTYGVAPPDTDGDVGLTYYVQMVNNGTQIFLKSDGSTVLGPFDSSTFWSGFTGSWTGTNDGDPIVMYDEQAARWVVTQFAINTTDGTQWMLIAVSTTSDPTGTYYRYAYEFTDMPDYPKLGIFLDSYVLTVNGFSTTTSSFTGTYICALDRTKMLIGPDGTGGNTPAMIQFFDSNTIASEFSFTWMPADIEGTIPAAGTNIPFVFDMADETYWTKDALVVAEMYVDWVTPANSTFTLSTEIPITHDTGLTTGAPQPSSADQLDLLNDRMMLRAQYRHFTTYDALLVTRTVDDGTDVAAIRWYELRNSGIGWSIYQNGTYAPLDGLWRWMPSIAMNGNGDIAIAYSVSDGTSVEPQIRATGRYVGDALNTMTMTETVLYAGNTSQVGVTRWGDYASLMVDPSDDYTFWFTTEYSNGAWDWATRVIEFSLPPLNPPVISTVSPATLYEDRGKQITITGTGLTGSSFDIGAIVGNAISNNGTTAVVDFPPGNYSNGTLTVTNTAGSDTYAMTVSTRNTIPVVAGAGVTSDDHPTIQSALDGLFAWYSTTAFSAGDLPGAKIIEVAAGTYAESITLNSGLTPDATNTLTIQPLASNIVVVDATGNDYGFNLSTVSYVTLKGFTVHSANITNIYAAGNNTSVVYNKIYGAVGNSSGYGLSDGNGIQIETGNPITVQNNIAYGNAGAGIKINTSSAVIKNNTLDDNGSLISPRTGREIFNDPFTYLNNWVAGNWVLYTGIAGSPSGDPFAGVQGNGAYQYITSNVIDITGYNNLSISCYYISYGGTLNPTDDLLGEYSFDGTTWTQFFSVTNDVTVWTQALITGLAPTSNTLYIRFGADIDAGEYYLVDDVIVTGDENFTAYNNGDGINVAGGTGNTLENNIVVAKAGNDSYFTLTSASGITVTSDYNTYYTTNTSLFDYNGTIDNLGPSGANDLTGDPVFIGGGDYHIFSTADSYAGGEWPPLTAVTGTWTTDVVNSPALDAGNPADAFANEPAAGGRINQGAYGNTVQASKTSSAVTINWTGAISTDWQTTGNWDSGTIPTSVEDVVIPTGMPNYPIINNGIGTVAVCNNMTIDASASVTIDVTGYMTVSGAITNNAGTAGLVINSDDTGTGSLIQNTSGGVSATVQCRLSSAASQWHMVSSPVAAAALTVFPSTSNLYYYDESTADYWTGTTYDAGSTIGWLAPSGNMGVAQGYAYNYFATTLNYTGLLNDNTSTSAILVPYTDNGVNAPNGASYDDFDGWNFIGNPYTSAIDWDNAAVAHGAANLNDAIYTYDDTNLNNYTSYVGGVGTNGGTQYIPAMQGFFVKGDATETGGTLNIGAAARVHNAQAYWKTAYETPENFLRLKITGNGYTDETVLRMLDGATNAMDNGTDAYKLFTWDENVPQIYTNTTSLTQYSINTINTISEGSISIPLKAVQTGNDYSIQITEFNFNGINVYLKDNLKNETIQIGIDDILNFVSDVSDNNDRFEIIFEKSASSIILAENSNITLYPNPNEGSFYLTVSNSQTNDYKVIITNITGQIIYKNKFNGNTSKIIKLANQSNGIYFMKIIFNDNSAVTKKIIKK